MTNAEVEYWIIAMALIGFGALAISCATDALTAFIQWVRRRS